jgi:hypothetical protein
VIDKLENHGKFEGETDSSATGEIDGEMEAVVNTKDYVAATLNAWSNCPGIVKK